MARRRWASRGLSGSQKVTEDEQRRLYRFDGLPPSGVYTVAAAKRHYTFAAPSQT